MYPVRQEEQQKGEEIKNIQKERDHMRSQLFNQVRECCVCVCVCVRVCLFEYEREKKRDGERAVLVYNFNVVARMLSMPNGQKNRSIEVPPLKLSIFTSISILYTVCTISLHPFDIVTYYS